MSSTTPPLRLPITLTILTAFAAIPLSQALTRDDAKPVASTPTPSTPTLTPIVRDDLFEVIRDAGFDGAFAVLDPTAKTLTQVNAKRCAERFVPASTFKVFTSLLALDCGAIDSTETILRWDGVNREIEAWNQDLSMRTALRESANWYFEELARRIGADRMGKALRDARYGNLEMGGALDPFWIDGELRISVNEQLDFLRRLDEKSLPFSPRTIDAVRDIMVLAKDEESTLRAKTGWSSQEGKTDVGWFVGSLEQRGKCVEFAIVLLKDEPDPKVLRSARRELAETLLRKLGYVVPH